MSKEPKPFEVPVGGTYPSCRHKVKRPRVVSCRVEPCTKVKGLKLIMTLSCGHEYVRFLPLWKSCYQCPVETIHFDAPRSGYRKIPFTTTRPQ